MDSNFVRQVFCMTLCICCLYCCTSLVNETVFPSVYTRMKVCCFNHCHRSVKKMYINVQTFEIVCVVKVLSCQMCDVRATCVFFLPLSLLATCSDPLPLLPCLLPPGQDKCSKPQQRCRSLLHPHWRPWPGHAGCSGGVLLQVPDRVAPNEGVHSASCCCLSGRLSGSGLSLLSLRQWCQRPLHRAAELRLVRQQHC